MRNAIWLHADTASTRAAFAGKAFEMRAVLALHRLGIAPAWLLALLWIGPGNKPARLDQTGICPKLRQ